MGAALIAMDQKSALASRCLWEPTKLYHIPTTQYIDASHPSLGLPCFGRPATAQRNEYGYAWYAWMVQIYLSRQGDKPTPGTDCRTPPTAYRNGAGITENCRWKDQKSSTGWSY